MAPRVFTMKKQPLRNPKSETRNPKQIRNPKKLEFFKNGQLLSGFEDCPF
jgi:hypothetical protein